MDPEGVGGDGVVVTHLLPSAPLGRRSTSATHVPEGPKGGGGQARHGQPPTLRGDVDHWTRGPQARGWDRSPLAGNQDAAHAPSLLY
jgi:hypothetical protein